MQVAGWLAFHFVFAAVVTWLARRYALRRHLLDQPGERRSHDVATPRGGGISIALLLLLASIWLATGFMTTMPMAAMPALVGFASGLSLVVLLGWADDHRPLSPWLRLSGHVLASLLFAAGVWMTGAPLWLLALALLAPLVLTNVWNFMDGIDGLATSQAAIAGLAFAWLASGAWVWLALALVAGCCGFLPFNFPKARIFLGDAGSGALGFALGGLLVATVHAEAASWPLALLPLSAFLIDAGLSLSRRILRSEHWWTPHVQHAYQVCSRRLQRHPPVTAAYAMWSLLALLLAWSVRDAVFTWHILSLLMACALGIALWFMIQQRIDDARYKENKE